MEGQEREHILRHYQSQKKKNVVIIGAGAAGMVVQGILLFGFRLKLMHDSPVQIHWHNILTSSRSRSLSEQVLLEGKPLPYH
jgi:hypothetical protein